METVAFETWSSYGVRFREEKSREYIRKLISEEFKIDISTDDIAVDDLCITECSVR